MSEKTYKNLIEIIAKGIYQGDLNLYKETGLNYHCRKWKTDTVWDQNPNELCEWERDEFRQSAKTVLDFLAKNQFLNVCLFDSEDCEGPYCKSGRTVCSECTKIHENHNNKKCLCGRNCSHENGCNK